VIKVFKAWIDRYLSDPEAILLLVILFGSLVILKYFAGILAPIFISIAIAMLLQFWVNFLEKHHCSHTVAYISVYIVFLVLFFGAILFLLPLLWKQCVNLITEMPTLIQNGKTVFLNFIHTKHSYVSEKDIEDALSMVSGDVQNWGKHVVTVSLASITGVITWIIYVILVPMLVFFFLRDHKKILNWFKRFLPQKRSLISKIWYEMQHQMGNYVRGKMAEVLIVTVFTYLVFLFFDMQYQVLLACLVGLSVIIPFVGVLLVTVPVLLVGYFQWGFAGGLTGEFALMLYSYIFIQLVDGGILVPLLFSEAVNLHPIAIIIAILFFGAIWGFWGVFFAIPLAILVKTLINAWPRHNLRHG